MNYSGVINSTGHHVIDFLLYPEEDIDSDGHISTVNYLKLFERARNLMLTKLEMKDSLLKLNYSFCFKIQNLTLSLFNRPRPNFYIVSVSSKVTSLLDDGSGFNLLIYIPRPLAAGLP